MDTNRNPTQLPGALDDAIFSTFGDEDSIVDRLLSMPMPKSGSAAASRIWEAAIARRAEQLLVDRMRAKLGETGRNQAV